MGYETTLYLVDVEIKSDSLAAVEKTIKTKKGKGVAKIRHFINEIAIDTVGFLQFRASGSYGSPYDPCEDDGTVPALQGKWSQAEAIAKWVSQHSCEGGMIVHHSCEGDGGAFGWEFDGQGNMRELALCAVGDWE
ncbi:MAG: hypothetical protein P8L85_01215 [Rubripirellula sp.]|nr:hypothetical protein [Rubripirellula sp.]